MKNTILFIFVSTFLITIIFNGIIMSQQKKHSPPSKNTIKFNALNNTFSEYKRSPDAQNALKVGIVPPFKHFDGNAVITQKGF
jgi:hypothetical protein